MFGDVLELTEFLKADEDEEYTPCECVDPAVVLAMEILLGLTDEE